MRWLIDGYNVIRRAPDLAGQERESLEAGRTALLRLIAAEARASQDDFTVVFDGARVTGGHALAGRVQVLFSRPPRTADDELMRLARPLGAGGVVVTSDRRVQDAARRAGCAVVTAEQFLDRLSAESTPEDKDDDDEEEQEAPRDKRGNPRRLSRDARATRRALRRLRRP